MSSLRVAHRDGHADQSDLSCLPREGPQRRGVLFGRDGKLGEHVGDERVVAEGVSEIALERREEALVDRLTSITVSPMSITTPESAPTA